MIILYCKVRDYMLNKKGFTIAEVVVSFTLISVILASMISATVYYRDKVKSEEVISQLLDFKNDITKTIYDDIVSGKLVRAERCASNNESCIKFIDNENNNHTLSIVETLTGVKKGVYLSYDGYKHMLPDSDLGDGNDRVCDFINGIELDTNANGIYKVKLVFYHKNLDLQYEILLVIS